MGSRWTGSRVLGSPTRERPLWSGTGCFIYLVVWCCVYALFETIPSQEDWETFKQCNSLVRCQKWCSGTCCQYPRHFETLFFNQGWSTTRQIWTGSFEGKVSFCPNKFSQVITNCLHEKNIFQFNRHGQWWLFIGLWSTIFLGVVCLLPPTFQPQSWFGFLRTSKRWVGLAWPLKRN